MPFSVALFGGAACEDTFIAEIDNWLPRFPESELFLLSGQILYDTVAGKHASAGSLDEWNWRELKVLPVSWFDGLSATLGWLRGWCLV